MKVKIILFLLVTLWISIFAVTAQTITQVNSLGVATSWYSDDTRTATGIVLNGANSSYQPYFNYPGAPAPTSADDAAIALQIKFGDFYTGSSGGVMVLDGTTANLGKSSVKFYFSTPLNCTPALNDLNVTFKWYMEPYTTNRTVALSLMILGTDGVVYSMPWVGEGATPGWNTFSVDANTVPSITAYYGWFLYGTGAPGSSGGGRSLNGWLTDPTWGPKLSGGTIIGHGFNIGSYQRYCRVGIDWLESSLLNGGNRIDFVAPVHNVTQNTFYNTIQAAINAATAGDVINVTSGTFAENVSVTKPLTLRGANYGISANDATNRALVNGSRVAESVVSPASGAAFSIGTGVSNVTIDGFKITGSGVTMGFWLNIGSGMENITISNNYLLNTNGSGISDNGASPNLLKNVMVSHNRFDGWTGADATAIRIYVGNHENITVTENYVNGSYPTNTTSRGIQVSFKVVNGAITNNTVENIAIWALYSANGQNGFTCSDNTVNNVGGSGFQFQGYDENYGSNNVTVSNNTFTNVRGRSVYAWGWRGDAFTNIDINNNTVNLDLSLFSGVSTAGIDIQGCESDPLGSVSAGPFSVTDNTVNFTGTLSAPAVAVYGLRISGTVGTITVSGNTLDGAGAGDASTPAGAGILLRTRFCYTCPYAGYGSYYQQFAGSLSADENIFTGGDGFAIFDPTASPAGYASLSGGMAVTLNNNDFSGTSGQYIHASSGGNLIDATCNWYGTINPNTIASGITGNIKFLPFSNSASPMNCLGLGPVVNTTQNLSYMTIQPAINAASANDVIEVAAGTYNETVAMGSMALTLKGANYGVAGSGSRTAESVVTGGFVLNGTANVTIDGFSVTGSNVPGSRGILLGNTSVVPGPITLSNNIIENWTTSISLAGGATYPWVSSVTVSGNLIRNNTAGIGSTENVAGLTVSNNTFSGNAEGIGLGPGLTGLAVTGNTFASTNSSHIAAYGSGLMPDYTTLFATNTFGKAAAVSATTGADYTTQSIYNTISAGITNAAAGATILVTAGTYTENLNINKRLTIDGAGSGSDPAGNTIITAASSGTSTIVYSAGGSDASNRQVLKDVRVTGASGGTGNNNSGILFSGGSMGYFTLDNIVSTNNTGHGLVSNVAPATSTLTDVIITGSAFSNNGSAGIRTASHSVDGFSLTNCSFTANAGLGIAFNPSDNTTAQIGGVTLNGVTFSGNNSVADLYAFRMLGNMSLTNVDFQGSNGSGLFGLYLLGGYVNQTVAPAIGTVTLDNVTVSGTYTSAGISFLGYSNLAGVNMTDVVLNTTVPTADRGHMRLSGVAGTLNLGNTSFNSANAPLDIRLGSNFNVTGSQSTVQVDATNATFDGKTGSEMTLTELFTLEDRIRHGLDNTTDAPGFVRVKASNVYVTTNSGSIQRGIDAATAGWMVNVNNGTYVENVNITKSVELRGANYGTSGCATRMAESVIQGSFTIGTDNITIDGFEFTGSNAQIASTSGVTVRSNITIMNNYLHATTAQIPIRHGLGLGGGIGSANWIVSNNKIEDIQCANATAIALFNVTNATINNNCITHTNASFTGRRGINADGLQTATINGNVINLGGDPTTNVEGAWLIQVSMSDQDAQNITIDGNTISNAYSGVTTLSQRNVTGLTITNNAIGPVSVGVTLNGGSATPAIAQPLQSNINIANNSISTVTPTVVGGIGAAVRLRNLHETHANGPVGFSNVGVNNNSFSFPSSDDGVINYNATYTLNATNNYWGGCPAFSGDVLVYPYYTTVSGTPGSLVFGGQIDNITASATSSTICAGSSTTILGTGGSEYLWDNGLGLGASKVVSPAATTTYNVTAKDANLCNGAFGSVTVTVIPAPTVTITGPSVVSLGSSITLTASGTDTYAWSNGATTAAITVSPTSATTYSVTGTTGTCSGTASHAVTVASVDAGANQFICSGGSATLMVTCNGFTPATYLWTPGDMITASVTVSPTVTTTYTVTVDGTMTDQVTVFVRPKPVASAGPDITIATGGSGTLTGSASAGTAPYSYSWTGPSGFTSAAQSPTVNAAGTYTLVVTDAYGCTSVADQAVVTVAASGYTVSGNVSYYNALNPQMHNVTVSLKQGGTTMYSAVTPVTGNGNFQILGVADGIYTVHFSLPTAWGGVTSADIIAIQKHYAVPAVPLTGLKRLAADVVDNSTNAEILANDRNKVNEKRLNPSVPFATGNWVFVKEGDVLANATPFVYANSAGTSNITIAVSGGVVTQNFKSLCYGDVDASYSGYKENENVITVTESDGLNVSNFPNPFSNTTTIRFNVPVESKVTITVHDLLGNRIATINDPDNYEGRHDIVFNANGLTPGIYLYTVRLDTGDDQLVQTGKMIINR